MPTKSLVLVWVTVSAIVVSASATEAALTPFSPAVVVPIFETLTSEARPD